MEDLSQEVNDSGEEQLKNVVAEEEEIEEYDDDKDRPPTPFSDLLEKSGTIDMIADALVTMYANPKPSPEIFSFFLNTIGAQEHPDVEKLLTENQELRKNIATLKTQIAELEARARK